MWNYNRNDALCGHYSQHINRKAEQLDIPLQERKVYGLAPEHTADIAVGSDMAGFVQNHGELMSSQYGLTMFVREDKPSHYIGISRKWRDQEASSIPDRLAWLEKIDQVKRVLLILAMWEGGKIAR